MNIYALVMIIPVVLAVALVVIVIRRNITERKEGQSVEIAAVIPAVIVLLVAAMVIGMMAGTTLPFSFDAEDGKLTISQNVDEGYTKYWAEYADDVESVVIEDGVTSIPEGSLATLTGIKQLTIPDSLENPGSLGVTLKDVFGEETASPGEYAGFGDGELWLCDPSIFTYDSAGPQITGLSSSGATAVTLVLPRTNGAVEVTSVKDGTTDAPTMAGGVFTGLLAIEGATYNISNFAFSKTSLVSADLARSSVTFGNNVFETCRSLTSVALAEDIGSISYRLFNSCSALSDFELPSEVNRIRNYAFSGCAALTELTFPSSLVDISQGAFQSCTGVTSVTFAPGFSPTINATAFSSWNFFGTDGETAIDKTVASNLAGHTFQGTASALVMVEEGSSELTPQQLQQVQLHTQELQQQELDIQPFTPSVQTNDAEVSA